MGPTSKASSGGPPYKQVKSYAYFRARYSTPRDCYPSPPRRLGEISLLDDNDTDFTMESGEWKDVDFCLQYTRQLTRKPSNNPNPSRKG
ncbi:hypothetical protein BLNAU_22351 [Blattamonas nauphoetae]|uniref:Uncharacterized protein n=1 Tax=Blattamonas nauphoetae TaxID=2049346 RepID=A0ABQ9WTT5_9EUKA|nr:hypothetical protein BLNAU_22351 [Blattamonas nauphoetae]